MNSYRIIFSLEELLGPDGQPNAPACTLYNMIAGHAQLVSNAIKEGNLPDAAPSVDIISDQAEDQREKILRDLEFFEIMKPRALLLGNDDIGRDPIIAVFDDNATRMKLWREGGIKCYNAAPVTTPSLIATL